MVFYARTDIHGLGHFKSFLLPQIIMHWPLPSQEYDLFSS